MKIRNTVFNPAISVNKLNRAKELRKKMTPPEAMLWKRLRTNKLDGIHFRRQQVILGYIVDFYCHEAGLIIEVDGKIHKSQKMEDARRERHLLREGYEIIRFDNQEIEMHIEKALLKIKTEVVKLTNKEKTNKIGFSISEKT